MNNFASIWKPWCCLLHQEVVGSFPSRTPQHQNHRWRVWAVVSPPRCCDAVMHPKGAENKFWSCEWTSFSDGRHFCVMNPVLDRFWYVEKLDFWFSWAVIIRIKTEKGLKHFTSYVMNLEYTTVSFLELISEMKWTFQLYSDFWRCSCRSYTFALLKGTNVVLKKKNEEIQIHRRLIFTILMM